MKYIIKNCPAKYFIFADEMKCSEYGSDCKDITDCVMKRIYERCELYAFNYPVNHAIQMLTQNIKNMLEIEEVDD